MSKIVVVIFTFLCGLSVLPFMRLPCIVNSLGLSLYFTPLTNYINPKLHFLPLYVLVFPPLKFFLSFPLKCLFFMSLSLLLTETVQTIILPVSVVILVN